MKKSILFSICIFTFILFENSFGQSFQQKLNSVKGYRYQKRITIFDRLAQNIIQYFNIDKLLASENQESKSINYKSSSSKCDSIEKVNDYFFNVYSINKTIDEEGLNQMIKYQNKGLKEESTQKLTKKNVCNRKEVI